MKLLILLEQRVPDFQFALGPANYVLPMPALYTQADIHTAMLQMTLDVQASHEFIQRRKTGPFCFPLLPGRLCMQHVRVFAAVHCAPVHVYVRGKLSGGIAHLSRELGQRAEEEVVRMTWISTQSVTATVSPLRKETQCE